MADDKKADGGSEHINLKVTGQDGSVVHFKIKKNTPLRKLMSAYCERTSVKMGSMRFRFDGQPINETDTPVQMRLIIEENYNKVSEWAAKYIRKRINEFHPGPDKYFTLGLPTGSTPIGLYKKLIEFHLNGELSFKYVKTFNMDEYVGLPRDHPESYHSFMWNKFFKHIDIDPANAHILDGNAPDATAECNNYERLISEAGGIELFVGGIGPDGHIAFNEPGSSLVSRTRVKTLALDTIEANAKFFDNDVSKVPTQAMTVGVGTVMDAHEVMILITGSHKAYALHMAIEEGINHMWTVSAFQQHPRTIFICDEDATLELKVKTVKYFKDLMNLHNKLIQD